MIRQVERDGAVTLAAAPSYVNVARSIWLYQSDCLSVLDAIAAKHPDGYFDMIFADPPYFLSNGGHEKPLICKSPMR